MTFNKLTMVALALAMVAGSAEAAPKRKGGMKRGDAYDSYDSRSSGAVAPVGMAGCGLGSMVVEDHGKWAQVASSILNGTGMQTFGISFGTSNCTEDGVASAAREKDAFVEANLSDIRRDAAAGNGEYLSSLASLYGCQNSKSFGAALQRNQGAIHDAASVDHILKAERVSCGG